MSNRNWNFHGPVESLRVEFAEWDLAEEKWQPPKNSSLSRFRPDGKITSAEYHNPDGSTGSSKYLYDDAGRLLEMQFGEALRYSYDELGRPLRVVIMNKGGGSRELESYAYDQQGKGVKTYYVVEREPGVGFSYAVEDTEISYGASDAATIQTVYDADSRPEETIFYGSDGRVLRRLVFHRDRAGRLLKEEMITVEDPAVADLPPELLKAAFGGIVTEYGYDDMGRIAERRMHMGVLSESRTTYRYDDHGNRLEEITEESSRDMGLNEEGELQPSNERSNRHHVRFEYAYDARGNWTECIVWSRLEPNPDFQRSNIQRREITYYPD